MGGGGGAGAHHRRFFFADRFEDEIDSSRRDFRFSTGEEDVRGSSYRRFSSRLPLFV